MISLLEPVAARTLPGDAPGGSLWEGVRPHLEGLGPGWSTLWYMIKRLQCLGQQQELQGPTFRSPLFQAAIDGFPPSLK